MLTATYKNKVTNEIYELSFDKRKNESLVETSYKLINVVCAVKGWQHFDIKVLSK